MDEARRRHLEEEADAALNLSRMLREQVRPQPQPSAKPGARANSKLHAWLDRLQGMTPEFLRAAVRPLYLNLFYRRAFPEYAAAPVLPLPGLEPLASWSGYAPFVEYKRRLCRSLSMDFGAFGCPSQAGLVSVVLPVYNGARYLAASIESVLAQTYARFELIVVDDGSTDETPSILERYAGDARVRCVRQGNRKLPAALNAGFALAQGEFFTWTSADNLMKPEMLARLTGFLQQHSGAEMVYADEELIDEAGGPAMGAEFCRTYQSPPGSNQLARPRDPGRLSFFQDNYIGGCFLYRAWAGRAVGEYCQDCFGFEDYDYWLRMNALFRISHLGERTPLYSYRLHGDSLTAREGELRIAERTRYFLPLEEERGRQFAGGFDIAFRGSHPWFPDLLRAYRQAGHNAFQDDGTYPEARAFEKRIVVAGGPPDPRDFAHLEGGCITAAGMLWHADSAKSLEYPLLAIANAYLASRKIPNASGT